jgi:uncharacterized membrane protein
MQRPFENRMRIPAADRALAFIGYLPLLFLLPVKLRRQSIFAQFHGRQSGVLFGLWLLVVAIDATVLLVLGTPPEPVSLALFGVLFVATAVYVLLMAIGMVKVLLGERYRMPVVADVALLLRL